MLSVGQFAKRANVSARTVRFYESMGLLPRSRRAENNYRFYDETWLAQMERIRDLQTLGFSLEEIKEILHFSSRELQDRLRKRLDEVNSEIKILSGTRQRLIELLSVSDKIETGEGITETERSLFMEMIRAEILRGLEQRYKKITEAELKYLERDSWFHSGPQMREFCDAVKRCVQFAKDHQLTLGPGRGSAPSSLTLYGLGFSGIDPVKHGMIPERLTTQPPQLHIDVEFERGQIFVDYCKEVTGQLSLGEIQAFKMPLIDIVKNVHKSIGQEISYQDIDDNSDLVLGPFRKAELEKIFCIDYSENALVMKYENFLPEFSGESGLGKLKSYFRSQKIRDFRDVINIISLWRPHSQEMVDRCEFYRQSKEDNFEISYLDPVLKDSLKPNFGRVIYHEDLLRIISHYTGWTLGKSNSLRKLYLKGKPEETDLVKEFLSLVPSNVAELVAEESRWAFCLPHAIAFAEFTKQTAVLKSLYRDVYLNEIEKFEQKTGFAWDDIGIRIKGVSLLQN